MCFGAGKEKKEESETSTQSEKLCKKAGHEREGKLKLLESYSTELKIKQSRGVELGKTDAE